MLVCKCYVSHCDDTLIYHPKITSHAAAVTQLM